MHIGYFYTIAGYAEAMMFLHVSRCPSVCLVAVPC